MEVKIEKLDHQGRGIGKINEKIVFVPNTQVGEIVEIEIVKEKKNYLEGNVKKWVTRTNRVEPICPYYNDCGGCTIQHLTYENQCTYKENKVKEIIQKYVGINIPIQPIIKSEYPFYYRNKTTFQVTDKIGFYKEKSHELIEIKECKISDNKINQLLEGIQTIFLKNIEAITIRASKNKQESMVILHVNRPIDENKIIEKLKNKTNSILVKYKNHYQTIYGKEQIIEKLGEIEYGISPDSFFQINTKMAEKLYQKVLEYGDFKKKEKVLDLYCGTGSIGLYISKYVKKVIGIEKNPYAIKDAIKTKQKNRVENIEFICGDALTSIKNINAIDTIIIDPPRAGLDKNSISNLIQIHAPNIIYVSCDPMTLARDLNILKEFYHIVEITPVDMFSNTYHVECVCKLKRI